MIAWNHGIATHYRPVTTIDAGPQEHDVPTIGPRGTLVRSCRSRSRDMKLNLEDKGSTNRGLGGEEGEREGDGVGDREEAWDFVLQVEVYGFTGGASVVEVGGDAILRLWKEKLRPALSGTVHLSL
ncbi:hypothetical protein BHE74_00053941 [Ensete ventricosum]|nr:hypothetical protein GW17_00051279 [Ensete ventricosum]RWW40628.1 hypothetical protein BHE74_00053941 [Ensete ventricosum]RZS24994.1 hypothetical protein BHM03_00058144 [Ensete ventricosum]